MSRTVPCPVLGCHAPALVTSASVLPLAGGHVAHIRIDCEQGHWFFDLRPTEGAAAHAAA